MWIYALSPGPGTTSQVDDANVLTGDLGHRVHTL